MMNSSNNTGGIIFISDWDAYFPEKTIDILRNSLLNSNFSLNLEEVTKIMSCDDEEDLKSMLRIKIDNCMGHRLTDEAREQSELGNRHKADDYKYSVTIDGKLPDMTLGVKETENKVDYSEINLGILDIMAERFTANKEKYPKGNMKKYIDKENLEWALFRHIKKMISPIENDPENYEEHLAAVLCNASMILDQLKLK